MENLVEQSAQLRRKLFSPKLMEEESVHQHIKTMMEVLEALTVIGDAVTEEDLEVYLLASLPASYDMHVTALEAQLDTVPNRSLSQRDSGKRNRNKRKRRLQIVSFVERNLDTSNKIAGSS